IDKGKTDHPRSTAAYASSLRFFLNSFSRITVLEVVVKVDIRPDFLDLFHLERAHVPGIHPSIGGGTTFS
ncbi:MAG: hypothetical protein QF577_04735, partial [Phycisphaerae bacterium]|nr:hypothetical protein [Phycisphaerae bacterium]